jgi:hypothetical protein
MSYHTYSSQFSPPSHSSSLSSSSSIGSSHSSYVSSRKFPSFISSTMFVMMLTDIPDSSIAARYEAAKSFDLEDDLEFCPALTMDEVRQYYDDVTAKSVFYPNTVQHPSPPSQSSSPSPPHNYIHPSPPHINVSRLINDTSVGPSAYRPPSRTRGTAAVKIIDPNTREERRRYY